MNGAADMDDLKRLDPELVHVFKTPDGVTGIVAACIPDEALEGLAQKLRARIAARECDEGQRSRGKSRQE
jgi:hypothetical protein